MLTLLSSCRLRRLLPLLLLWVVVLGLSPTVQGRIADDPMTRLATDLAVLCTTDSDNGPAGSHTPDGLPCTHCPECLPVGLLIAPPPQQTALALPHRRAERLRPAGYTEPVRAGHPPRPPGQGPPHSP